MELTVIAPTGDIILDIQQENRPEHFHFRVQSETLQHNSRYFEALLSDRFSEGSRVLAELQKLKLSETYKSVADAPADELPVVAISDVGRISNKVSSIKNLIADFLRALHGLDLGIVSPPVPNLANLAVVADRFDALPHFAKYVARKKYLQTVEAKAKGKSNPPMTEERMRQKLLVGILLDHAPWVTKYSKALIMTDSMRWKPQVEEDHGAALWWDIPRGLEDEMITRREYILETINSLQGHFLKLYTSGERQCKLGYDSSIQCDSFQLGEMVRFFIRLGTLRLQGTIYDTEPSPIYNGDIDRLLESLRQCSSYQIDRNHAHCGLRTRLLPHLDHIQNLLCLDAGSIDIGVCTDCWNNNRSQYAWSKAKRPLIWSRSRLSAGIKAPISQGTKKERPLSQNSCLNRHLVVRDMFMAVDRDWTANSD